MKKKANVILSLERFDDFHQELTNLLKKYDLHADGVIELKTLVTNFNINCPNCKPGCCVYGQYKDQAGKDRIGYYCAC